MKELEFIYLLNEDGQEEKMRVITFFKIEELNQEYVIVTPAQVEVEEAYVLKYLKDEDGNENYVTIEDDKEFELVLETYELLMEQEIEE